MSILIDNLLNNYINVIVKSINNHCLVYKKIVERIRKEKKLYYAIKREN
jgi:hypothetical protein